MLVLKMIYQRIIVPFLYVFTMWLFLGVGVSLLTKDFYQGFGAVSAFVIFYVVRDQFYREFFGRNNLDAVQKQTKGK